MRKIAILSMLSVVSFFDSTACSCLQIGNSFCQTITADTTIVSVVMVKKIADYHYGMRVRCLATIGGQSPADTLLIWGDNGILCRKSTGNYLTGDTLILALQKCDKSGNTLFTPLYPGGLESSADYQLSGCGVYCLRVNRGFVLGAVTAATQQQLPLHQLLNQYCGSQGASVTAPSTAVLIGPNPVADQLFVQFAMAQQGVFRMYNSAGQLVVTTQFNTDQFTTDLNPFQAGLYFVEVETDALREVRQVSVVKMATY
jgi:Secretion system C-terminal sorting domain